MAKTPDNVDFWKFIRGKIEHEDSWIQQRVSWNLASSSFLLAAYTALLFADKMTPSITRIIRLLIVFVPFLGFSLSIFVLFGLAAAWIATSEAKAEWTERVSDDEMSSKFPEMHSTGIAFWFGKVASWGTAIFTTVVWFILLISTWFKPVYFIHHPWR